MIKKSIVLALALGAATSAVLAEPQVSARKALEIAEKSLADRGLQKKIWVEAVTLDKSSMFGGKQFWFVRWNASLPASDPKNKEVGVKVYMDGTAVRLVKEPGA